MKSKKSTGELLHEIATTKQDFESFANENKDEFDEFDSRDYLNRLLNTKNLQPTDIIRRSGLERSYVYHILNGERKNPSQGKVIALCIAFELTVEQTQRLCFGHGNCRFCIRVISGTALFYMESAER